MKHNSPILTLIDESVSEFRHLSNDSNLSGDQRKQIEDLLKAMKDKPKLTRIEALQSELYRFVLVNHDPVKGPRQLQCLIATATVLLAEKMKVPPSPALLVGDVSNAVTKLNQSALDAAVALKKELADAVAALQTSLQAQEQIQIKLDSEGAAFIALNTELDRVNGLLEDRDNKLKAAASAESTLRGKLTAVENDLAAALQEVAGKVPVSDEAALSMMSDLETANAGYVKRISELEQALVEAHAKKPVATATSLTPTKDECHAHVQAALAESRLEFKSKVDQIDALLQEVRKGLDTGLSKVMMVGAIDLCLARTSEMA